MITLVLVLRHSIENRSKKLHHDLGKNLSLLLLLLIVVLFYLQCCSHVYNLMLLKCRTLHALKFALVSKSEAMHHLALENMKNLKVNILFVAIKKLDLYRTDV